MAISDEFIISTSCFGKTFVYSNALPDFVRIAEIDQGGQSVEVSGDRILTADGTIVKTSEQSVGSSYFSRGVGVACHK